MNDRIDEIKTKWNFDVTLPMAVPWGKDDVVWLVGEVERLRAEAHHAQALRAALCVARAALVDPIRLTLPQIDAALTAHAAHLKAGEAFRRFRHCLEFDEDAPIEAVIEAAIQRLDYDLHLVGENARLRHAALEVLSWSLKDMTALLTNPPQNAALFHAQRVLRKAMGD